MHPGDHAGAVFIQIGFIEGAADQLVGDQGRLPYNLVGQHTGSIQGIYDFVRMLRHLRKALVSIQVLRACTKPELIVFCP